MCVVRGSFTEVFQDAMELSVLGLYEKEEKKLNLVQKDEYVQSPLLKKALDKFSLLMCTFSLFDTDGFPLLPTDEATLIQMFNFPMSHVIDKLPKAKRQDLVMTEWYRDDAYVSVGYENEYYCLPELLDKLNERTYQKVINSRFKELELQSQKFIELLFDRDKDEYPEVRDFLSQKMHTFITGSMFIQSAEILQFKQNYPEIFAAAYQELTMSIANDTNILKVCRHCGLVLKEMQDGTLYCVSDRCERKTKGFATVDEIEVGAEDIWVLRQNVARFIYYPGLLEQRIKNYLIKENLNPKLWPNMDEWDFEFIINNETWVVDAKDVRNPNWIVKDIAAKEREDLSHLEKVLYVVPHDRRTYVDAVNRMVKNKEKIKCITFPGFKRMVVGRQVISQ